MLGPCRLIYCGHCASTVPMGSGKDIGNKYCILNVFGAGICSVKNIVEVQLSKSNHGELVDVIS